MRDPNLRQTIADYVLPMIGASLGAAIALSLPPLDASGAQAEDPPAARLGEADLRWLSLPEGIAPEYWGFK